MKVCDQIVSFIHEEWTPIYTFQFARHFAEVTPLLVRSRNIRTNEVPGITSMPMLKRILHACVTGPSVTQYALGLKILNREAPWRLKARLIY
jgi:hypothetical protein